MNKRAFSLTLLLSVPTALLSGTGPQNNIFSDPAVQKIFLDASVLLVPVWINKAYSDGTISDCSNSYERLKGMSAADRMCIVFKTAVLRTENSILSEQDALNKIIIAHEYDTTYAHVIKYASREAAEKLATSFSGNVRAVVSRNGFTGHDLEKHFGQAQKAEIERYIRTYYQNTIHTRLPGNY